VALGPGGRQSSIGAATAVVQVMPSRARTVTAWGRLGRDPAFWVGGVLVATIVIAAAAAPWIAPHDPDFGFRVRDGGLTPAGDPVGPSARFLLGTDLLGRDYLARLLFGARTSLIVGLVANALASVLGVAVGAAAAFVGTPRIRPIVTMKWFEVPIPVEALLMRITDVLLALPALLLAIALAAVVGPSMALVTTVIAALLWTTTARIVYGRVLDLKRREFVDAAEAIGVSSWRILLRHVMPHVVPVVVVYATLGIATTVLFETTLSYLGAGVPPPTPSWGSMLAEHVSYYASQPRLVLLPGLAITVTILAFNLLGDALRDALDPHGEAAQGSAIAS
jgi:peptide/nickel transport system permease protein